MTEKQLKTQLRKVKGVRFLQVHAVTPRGKMMSVVVFNDEKPRRKR